MIDKIINKINKCDYSFYYDDIKSGNITLRNNKQMVHIVIHDTIRWKFVYIPKNINPNEDFVVVYIRICDLSWNVECGDGMVIRDVEINNADEFDIFYFKEERSFVSILPIKKLYNFGKKFSQIIFENMCGVIDLQNIRNNNFVVGGNNLTLHLKTDKILYLINDMGYVAKNVKLEDVECFIYFIDRKNSIYNRNEFNEYNISLNQMGKFLLLE